MTKRKYILLMVLCMAWITAAAQPRLRTPEIYVGAHGGVMASTVQFKPSVAGMDILQSPLSANGGLVFRYAGHKVCAIQVEANYMQRGWKETTEGVAYRRQLDYIEIPLLMHLYFGKGGFRGFFNLGPQVGYCIRDVAQGTTNPKHKYQYAKIDNAFDWGAAAGLGVCYRTKKIGLFQLEARFNYSLGGAFKVTKMDYFQVANHMNLSLNLGYLWELRIKN